MKDKDFKPEPGSQWLVTVECITQVIAVAVDGSGFFIPGQEPCWHFPHVQEWIRQVWPIDAKVDAQNLSIVVKDVLEIIKTGDEATEGMLKNHLQNYQTWRMHDRDAMLDVIEVINYENARLEAENRKLRDQLQNSQKPELAL